METEKKFIRGTNYTTEDKNLLLSLVESEKRIIECKETNKVSSEAKKKAWEGLTKIFNASSNVQRTSQQLKTLYENLKRRGRKDVAMENKERYKQLLNEENGEDLEELQHRARQEKKEMNATGGGTFKTNLSETQHRLLSILEDNVRPLENVYDDANIYFEIPIPDVNETLPIPTQEIDPILQCSTSSPQKKIKKRKPSKRRNIKKALSPKDRYYLQKLANAKIEGKILSIQLSNLLRNQ